MALQLHGELLYSNSLTVELQQPIWVAAHCVIYALLRLSEYMKKVTEGYILGPSLPEMSEKVKQASYYPSHRVFTLRY